MTDGLTASLEARVTDLEREVREIRALVLSVAGVSAALTARHGIDGDEARTMIKSLGQPKRNRPDLRQDIGAQPVEIIRRRIGLLPRHMGVETCRQAGVEVGQSRPVAIRRHRKASG